MLTTASLSIAPVYKNAGDLTPGDVYLHQDRAASRPQARRVVALKSGLAATTVEIVGKNIETGRIKVAGFFRCNRVQIVAHDLSTFGERP